MVQKRIDIEDGTAYTWKSLFKHYKKTYDYLDIVEYWKGPRNLPPTPRSMVLESGSSVGISTAGRVSVSLSVIVADLG